VRRDAGPVQEVSQPDAETGFVKIRSYLAVDDIGMVVNPLIVEGRVHGGLAQGIAQALDEKAVYDDDGVTGRTERPTRAAGHARSSRRR
jgi:CO/xanthine dehydrogenase Mo-binding subunit